MSNVFYKYNSGDVVSFSAKKYDADAIVNPTNHCAYCGCKVYTEQQIDSIAKEILTSKSGRLEGKIKSILEKLEGAKHSDELSVAKRIENEEQIKFFRNFLEISSRKSYLRGDAIFAQVYEVDRDKALELLVTNMHPLLRTIDHISPQNLEQENNNSDVNLVEACYCCNHDLKKGSPFNEFFTMFPSIKQNMPADKFEYAMSNLLDSSSSGINKRLSASNMLKFLERLFIQRTDAMNNLDSINFRIKTAKDDIQHAIDECKQDIEEKEQEIAELEEKHAVLSKDFEYVAILNRINLQSTLSSVKDALDSLRARLQRQSAALNELRNPKQGRKSKKKDELSPAEKEEKIKSLRSSIDTLNSQIAAQEEQETRILSSIKTLDDKFPSIDMLQQQKRGIDRLIANFNRIDVLQTQISELTEKKDGLEAQMKDISSKLSAIPDTLIKPEECSDEQNDALEKYKMLIDALKFIKEHSNGVGIKAIINHAAEGHINEEIIVLRENPVVQQFDNAAKRTQLTAEYNKLSSQFNSTQSSLDELTKEMTELEKTTADVSRADAETQSAELAEAIRRVNDKMIHIKIPQRIATLKAEVTLLESTIENLMQKQNEIDALYQ